jgi:serine/threonine protein kinase
MPAGNRFAMAVRDGLLPERYVAPQAIGRGGMGQIFRATDTTLGRAVAIKVLDDRYARDESVRARYTREALAAARLSGTPNLVTIYDVGEHGARLRQGIHAGRRRDPEVGDVHAVVLVEQEVGRFDIAVHDTLAMCGVERFRSLLEPLERLAWRHRPTGA